MTAGESTEGRRRGRPPASDSADTHRAILDAGRRLFAARGYSGVTNKDVAEAVDLTTSSLYHYVPSKLDLYEAIDVDTQRLVYDRFRAAVDGETTFLGKLFAVLDAADELHRSDPSLSAFVGMVRVDMRQHPEIAERLAFQSEERDEFFLALADVGLASGEIPLEHRAMVIAFIRTVLLGLTEGSTTPEQYHCSIEAVKRLLCGGLVNVPPPSRGSGQ